MKEGREGGRRLEVRREGGGGFYMTLPCSAVQVEGLGSHLLLCLRRWADRGMSVCMVGHSHWLGT